MMEGFISRLDDVYGRWKVGTALFSSFLPSSALRTSCNASLKPRQLRMAVLVDDILRPSP